MIVIQLLNPSLWSFCLAPFQWIIHVLKARSIGLIRIGRTPPFSDEAFDWAQLNPDESSELIQLIRKSTDEFGWAWHAPTPARGREGFTTSSFGSLSNDRATQPISSHLMSVVDGWIFLIRMIGSCLPRARSIGLIRIRKTHPSTTPIRWDEMSCVARSFDWDPDEGVVKSFWLMIYVYDSLCQRARSPMGHVGVKLIRTRELQNTILYDSLIPTHPWIFRMSSDDSSGFGWAQSNVSSENRGVLLIRMSPIERAPNFIPLS